MDRVRVELLGPFLLDDARRRAERDRLFHLLDCQRGKPPLVGLLGLLLVRVGNRLEALAGPCPPSRSLVVTVPPCHGHAG